jgi:hypothetical protein
MPESEIKLAPYDRSKDPFWSGYREGIDYPGRPDHSCLPESKQFWVKRVKKHLPYAHGKFGSSFLIHKVAYVTATWYEGRYSYMRRLENPKLIAHCICGRFIFLTNGKRSGKMCSLPDPNAVLCGTCHGQLPTFSKRRILRIKKRWAKDHLGCKGIHEVLGPYEPPPMSPNIEIEIRRKDKP